MPRSRSRSIESRNCAVISRELRAPVRSIRRSDRVVFPWSMWAMMEKLRMFCMVAGLFAAPRPADHDHVQPRPADEEPAALLVEPECRVVTEQPVGQGP